MKEIRRNKLDIILTDLRPVELPRIFTLKYFYEDLVKNQIKIGKVNGIGESKDSVKWNSAPIKYHVLKNEKELREISLPNPLAMIEIVFFMNKYSKQFFDYQNRDSYSIRRVKKNNNFEVTKINDKKINYKLSGYNNTEIRGESSGTFNIVYPYSRLTSFYKSKEWFDFNIQYNYFGKIDYNKCFDSIYTHSFKWIISNEYVETKSIGNKDIFLTNIDILLRTMNCSVTNGIIVGPEIMRQMAEIILIFIDEKVKNELLIEGLAEEDFAIRRYIDDIYIFSNRQEVVDEIIKKFEKHSEYFKLSLNYSKSVKGKLPHIWVSWITDIILLVEMLEEIFLEDSECFLNYSKLLNLASLSKYKNYFIKLCVNNPDEKSKMVSYILSFIMKKLLFFESKKIKMIKNNGYKKVIYNLTDLVMFFFSFSTTFNNCDKTVSCLMLIKNNVGTSIFSTIFNSVLKSYYFILNKNVFDLSNFIIFLSFCNCEIPQETENKMRINVLSNKSPLMYALYLFYSVRKKHGDVQFNLVEEISEKIVKITKSLTTNDYYKNKDCWWLFIFSECPYLSKEIRYKIDTFFRNINIANIDIPVNYANSLLIEFLVNEEIRSKFIKWQMVEEDFNEILIYSTYERTIFANQDDCYDDFIGY